MLGLGMGIKPQDILILLKIIAMRQQPWRQVEISDELAISHAEVSNSLERCLQVGLIDEDKRTPHKTALLEFIQYGLKYVFAAKPGPMVRGILTAHAAPPFSSHIVSDQTEAYVWSWPEGEARGQEVEPPSTRLCRGPLKVHPSFTKCWPSSRLCVLAGYANKKSILKNSRFE